MEPAVRLEHLGRGGRVVPVADEDLPSGQQQFAVLGHFDAGTWEWLANRSDLDRARSRDCGRCRCLGQAVALEHCDADTAEEVTESSSQGGTTGDSPLHLATHRCPQLLVDELVEQPVLELESETGATFVERLAVLDRGVCGLIEDVALALRGGLLLRGVVNLLEHAGDSQHERRLKTLQKRQQLLDVGRVTETCLRADCPELDQSTEDVGDRQEEQRGGSGTHEHVLESSDDILHLEHEVLVGQHAALRAPCRPRGVDDGGQGVWLHGGAASFEFVVTDARTGSLERLEVVVVEHPHPRHIGQVGSDLIEDGLVLAALGEQRHCPGVGQVPGDLLGRGRFVDGYRDSAGVPDGVVDEGPLVPRTRHHADAFPGPHPAGHDALGDGLHLIEELCGRDAHPRVAALQGENHLGGVCLRVLHDVVGEIARCGGRNHGWDAELLEHVPSPSLWPPRRRK